MTIAAGELPIINEALNRLGQRRITSSQLSTPDNKVSNLVVDSYENHRNALLRDHPWNFALNRLEITKNVTAPVWEYTYAYDLPDGSPDPKCLRVLKINDDDVYIWTALGWRQNRLSANWKVEGRQVVTNYGDTIKILYLAEFTTYADMDPMFIDALSAKLAMHWAEPLASANTLREQQGREFVQLMREARSIDGQEGILDPFQTTDWIGARQ